MKLQLLQDTKNHGLIPPIFFNPKHSTGNNPDVKVEYLNIDIKTNPGETYTKTVPLYVPIFFSRPTKKRICLYY